MSSSIFDRFKELEGKCSIADVRAIDLSLIPKFILSDYHSFIREAQNIKDQEDVFLLHTRITSLVKSTITLVFSKNSSSSDEIQSHHHQSRVFLESFPLNDTKYYLIWVECWKPFLRFISSSYLPSLEIPIVNIVAQKALDYTMACDEDVSLGKIAWALMKVLLRSSASLSIDGLGKLIEAARKYRFSSAKDQESVEEILQRLISYLGDRKKEVHVFSNFPEYPSAQEMIYKFPSIVFYILFLKKDEQQDLMREILVNVHYSTFTKYLIAELLTRSCSQTIMKLCHTILDSNCPVKSIALIRNLPLSLCPGDVVQKVTTLLISQIVKCLPFILETLSIVSNGAGAFEDYESLVSFLC
jgi:hypothetical protein